MLTDLRIRSLAVIEDLEIGFEPGFNVVTGETGAGKTMLMRALGLVLGGRGGAELVREGAKEAEIEAIFAGDAVAAARAALTDDGPTEGSELAVRRVVSASGRQRAYVDDRLITTMRLAAIGERLVHVYGQHEHQSLLRAETARLHLDAAVGLESLVATMASRFRALVEVEERLAACVAGAAGAEARRELLAFQCEELARLAPRTGEIEALERERAVLRHAERLRDTAAEAEGVLYAGEGAVLDVLARVAQRLGELRTLDAELGIAADLLGEVRPAIEDAALRAGARARAIQADPGRLEQIEERVAALQRLARKHGAEPEELPARREALERALAELTAGDTDPAVLETAAAAAAAAAWAAADALTAARARHAPELGRRITDGIHELALGNARLELAVEPHRPTAATPRRHVRNDVALAATGAEQVTWMFAPNPGESARPLAKVASGGELSRIMLAIKAATAGATDVPTLLFDEVDAGIGGAVAETVGRKLAALAAGRQVICITHLPQIAACAEHHFAVRKQVTRGRTRSSAERLSDDERVDEIARMLAGVTVTKEARRHAAELRRLGAQRSR
ncbi:MAG: DNA repair protein RecN [Deltaproteobacteria bacterium]|nr:DNA repair protein RecN [Deltaproteobacteria bacterium]